MTSQIMWIGLGKCIVQLCTKSHIGCLIGQTRLYKWLRETLIATWLALLGYSAYMPSALLES